MSKHDWELSRIWADARSLALVASRTKWPNPRWCWSNPMKTAVPSNLGAIPVLQPVAALAPTRKAIAFATLLSPDQNSSFYILVLNIITSSAVRQPGLTRIFARVMTGVTGAFALHEYLAVLWLPSTYGLHHPSFSFSVLSRFLVYSNHLVFLSARFPRKFYSSPLLFECFPGAGFQVLAFSIVKRGISTINTIRWPLLRVQPSRNTENTLTTYLVNHWDCNSSSNLQKEWRETDFNRGELNTRQGFVSSFLAWWWITWEGPPESRLQSSPQV